MVKNKYHIDINGNPALCHANVSSCPRGSENEHYTSKEEAKKAYEKKNEHKNIHSLKKNNKKNVLKFASTVSAVAAIFSLTACDTNDIKRNLPSSLPTSFSTSIGVNSGDQSDRVLKEEQQAKTNAQDYMKKLGSLDVKGRAPKTGYARDKFISDSDWTKVRTSVLERDLNNVSMRNGHVGSGSLTDPYTSKNIDYTYGDKTAVDIDHVVSLGDAWETGIQYMSPETRKNLASDPDNLLAVDYSANRQKGDSDAASWLPPNKAYRCVYVEKQINVKQKYQIWVTPAEKDAMNNVLNNC